MLDSPLCRASLPSFGHRFAIVVDDMHGPGHAQDVDQRWHRQQNRIDRGIAPPHHTQAGHGRDAADEEHHHHQLERSQQQQRQPQSQGQRVAYEAHQSNRSLFVDRHVVYRWSADVHDRFGDQWLRC